ncbi:MAG TPA: SH3 domain-containing protein [Deltaproteobacteria bacterium]|nr:SH3 domain-containing protein [Deltaproteobacteria bacterium]
MNGYRIKRQLVLMMSVVFLLQFPAAAAERYAVSSELANIRSGPGTNYEKLWQVWKYHPVTVLNKKGPWFYFKDFEGDEGWIHNSLLQKMDTVISIKKTCNIRSGPGTENKVEFTVTDGISFKVLGRKGYWIQVEHADGDQGWIHKSLVW